MPTKTTPTASVTVDKPNYAGRVTKWAHELDYQFVPPKTNGGASGGAEANHPVYGYSEFLPAFGCIRPKGVAYLTDMQISDTEWVVENGLFRTVRPAILANRTAFLDYYDSAPDHYGSVCHQQMHLPNMAAVVVRCTPPENTDTYGCYTMFEFLGNNLVAVPERKKFAFFFPVHDPVYQRPVLCMDDVGSTTYTPVAEWEEGTSNQSLRPGIEVDELWFEWVDGAWHIRRSGVKEAWVYRPEGGDLAFSPGYVRFYNKGHACLAWFGDATYQAMSVTTMHRHDYVGGDYFSTTRTWHYHGWFPDPRWTATITEEADAEDGFRPLVTIAQNDGSSSRPPCLYVVSAIAEAEHDDASSSSTTLNKAAGYRVERVTYELNNTGRGQSCTVEVVDKNGTSTLATNMKLTASVGWNQDDGTTAVAQKFFGYITAIERQRQDDPNAQTPLTLTVGDPIEARLTKKFMVHRSAAGGEDLAHWLWHLLYNAGVPSTQLTSIYDLIGLSATIPMGQPKGDLRFRFSDDVCIVDAADEVCEACGWEWGWNAETNIFFLRLPVNTPLASVVVDYELDEDDTAVSDFKREFAHERDDGEFRNVLYVLSETEGEQSPLLYLDDASRSTSSDPAYIGDDWWEVATQSDDPTGAAKTQKRWQELIKQHSEISWTMRGGNSSLGPGKFVKMVNVTKAGVVDEAIYQIVSERGELRWGTDQPEYSATFTARIWVTE